jgi:ppGpp synthetase/RelA/SpoT-type nucleotidyltranferase
VEQLSQLFHTKHVTLGVPMESRVKSLASIQEKIERKAIELKKLVDLDDLVGIRTILLFSRDVAQVHTLIAESLDVVRSENTAERLGEGQFGYQSQHYVVRLPKSWLAIPSLSDLDGLSVEIQVRTLAQHIWAAASHKLQYKHEESVPLPLRRTIHRVSALLETVDLEFERVLEERQQYIKTELNTEEPTQPLNVDVLEAILSELLPEKNKAEQEPFADLLENLTRLNIATVQKLRALLGKHREAALKADASQASRRAREQDYKGTTKERIDKGVFFRHVGLVRNMLRREFGNQTVNQLIRNTRKPAPKKPNPSLKRTRTGKPTRAA